MTPAGAPIFGLGLAGESTSFARGFSGMLGVEFEHETGWNWFGDGVNLREFAQVFYTDEFQTNFDADSLTVQEIYYKINARLGLGGADGGWELAVIGCNLNNKITSHSIENTPQGGLNKFAQTDRPREVVVPFRLNL